MSLLAVSPTLGEFSNYTGPLSKRTKKSSRITKSLNYRGISVILGNFEGTVEFFVRIDENLKH